MSDNTSRVAAQTETAQDTTQTQKPEKSVPHPGSPVVMQSLGKWGKQLAMRPQGRQVQQELDALLRQLPPDSVLVVDFDGVEMMDYSFADEALGALFSRMSAKEYPNRYVVLAAGEGELGEALLENVEVALSRREVAALVLPKDQLDLDEESTELNESAAGSIHNGRAANWRVAGTLPAHLVETLRAVMEKQQVTVRELADALQIDSATACNNRIAKLYQLRLVRREAAIVPEGGRQYFYSAVI
ncbi:MAG: hypothetical protein JWN98_1025 [Abditibacteriota bacterium]|nr:hypothetical protein [Abditibacteriota bacterium]